MRTTAALIALSAASITAGAGLMSATAGATTPSPTPAGGFDMSTIPIMVRPVMSCADPLGTMPNFTIPDFTIPDFTIPGFTIPELTGMTMPEMPNFTIPNFTIPDFTIPDFTIPDVTGITIPRALQFSNDPAQPATHMYMPPQDMEQMTSCDVGPTTVLAAAFAPEATAVPNADGSYAIDVPVRPGAEGADALNALVTACFNGDATCAGKELAVEVGDFIVARIPVTSADPVTVLHVPGPYTQADADEMVTGLNQALAAQAPAGG